MIAAGELGRIRVVQVEYAQDWLTTAVEATGQKKAVWRTDPARIGPAGSICEVFTLILNHPGLVAGLQCGVRVRYGHHLSAGSSNDISVDVSIACSKRS